MSIAFDFETISKLKQEYQDFYHYKNPDNFFKKHRDTLELLSATLKGNPWFKNIKFLFRAIANDVFDVCHCECCGVELSPEQVFGKKEIHRCCSTKCSRNSEFSKQKRKKTCIERYGSENVFQNESVKDKAKKTCVERYGVEHVLQSETIKNKVKNTMLERYGVEHAIQSQSVQDKIKNTMLERYGVEHAMQNKDIHCKQENTMTEKYGNKYSLNIEEFRNKYKATSLKRYGFEHASMNEEIKRCTEERKKHTLQEKYNVENVFQLEEVKEKAKKTNIERYGSWNPVYSDSVRKKIIASNYRRVCERLKDYAIPLFTEEEYCGWKGEQYGMKYNWKCVKCGSEFSDHIHSANFAESTCHAPRCSSCFPKNSGFSYEEKDLVLFLKENCSYEIIENCREIIPPFEIDAYIPEKQIAIEFDGLHWHSEESVGSGYHLYKTNECMKKGIVLIHVFEDEWICKKKIVKDRIGSLLGIGQRRIFARKCQLKEIGAEECACFLEENHLQGRDNSKYRYGLFYDRELMAVMTFGKPRFNKNYDYELIRYCSKIGCSVVGGAGKLLAYFRRSHEGSIISYADRRYSVGNLYEKLGFVKKHVSKPNYFWVYGMKKYSRYHCQKHKLAKLLGDNFNPDLSESENMVLNGYEKIYDCGNIVYAIEKLDEMAQ